MNCFCLLFRPETRFLKSFTANILSQFRALHFTRSDRGQGGAHYHHIQPVKSPQTDFTQNLPLVKWEFMNGAFLTVTALTLYDEECLERS